MLHFNILNNDFFLFYRTFSKAKNRNAHKKIHRLWDHHSQNEKAPVTTALSCGEAAVSNSSPSISFSTCLNFGLSHVSKQVEPKEELTEESSLKSDETELQHVDVQKETSVISSESPSKEQLSNMTVKKETTTTVDEDTNKAGPTAAQLDEIFSSLLCPEKKEKQDSSNVTQSQEIPDSIVNSAM